jgi:hypothetical protein
VDESTPGPGGNKGPNSYAPKPQFEYRAPSILWEHRYLLIVFVVVILVATVLLFRAPHRPLTIEPPPVYVEPIPERPVVPEPPVPNR